MNTKTRGPAKLAHLTYERIAELSGMAVNTVKAYASRGHFDARNLQSAMEWINKRRALDGKDLIGIPNETQDTQ